MNYIFYIGVYICLIWFVNIEKISWSAFMMYGGLFSAYILIKQKNRKMSLGKTLKNFLNIGSEPEVTEEAFLLQPIEFKHHNIERTVKGGGKHTICFEMKTSSSAKKADFDERDKIHEVHTSCGCTKETDSKVNELCVTVNTEGYNEGAIMRKSVDVVDKSGKTSYLTFKLFIK